MCLCPTHVSVSLCCSCRVSLTTKVEVHDDASVDEDKYVQFYTALYHAFMAPTQWSEVRTGERERGRGRGAAAHGARVLGREDDDEGR